MRFDDSLETVLAADISSPFGAQSAWRQLVDLVGRGRVLATSSTIERLRAIRPMVAPPVRAASARAIAGANPPAALVRLFVEDEIAVAAPLLRVVSLPAHHWVAMLPAMTPTTRSILRHRRDLAPEVRRALESFGTVDFVLSSPIEPLAAVLAPETATTDIAVESVTPGPEPLPIASEVAAPETDSPAALPDAPVAVPEPVVTAPDTLTSQAAPPVNPIAALTPAPEPLTIDWTDVVGPIASDPDAAPTIVADARLIGEQAVPAFEPDTGRAPTGAAAGDDARVDEPEAAAALVPPATSFVSIASVARGLPVVAEALRRSSEAAVEVVRPSDSVVQDTPAPSETVVAPAHDPAHDVAPATAAIVDIAAPPMPPMPPPEATAGTFQIAELVARIDAYQRQREDRPAMPLPSAGPEVQPELFVLDHAPAEHFRFETDAAGVVRWIEGAARAPLIGLSLDLAALPHGSQVDGVAAGAFRRRASFTHARLVVEGQSDAAGQWRISGVPVFDRASGRFTGYRGTARRPRADEMAEPAREGRNPATDALRQLVHELRTPANAIAGFAEMIESQLLGPVPQPYRVHAATIRNQTHDLLGAIDDIDMAARIESDALELRAADVPVAPLLARIGEDLMPLARLRGATLAIDPGADGMAIAGDDRAVERLIARLAATLVSSASPDERIAIVAGGEGDRTVSLRFDRPRALGAYAEDKLLTIDAEVEAEREGAPLLGTGFALRLARNLATELGGTLTIGEDRLTLRLPAAFLPQVEQVFSN
ncbi:sensor histidine kinase [Sphingomonas sp. RT2P30]|uniref:sensor histidine kinase n=1 Tax=Parasphingomonas halimpatiens TaxID=3096162 RepID=UPI002FC7B45A